MSFDKDMLIKIADQVRTEGVTVKSVRDLRKKASDLKAAFLIALIRK